MKLTQKIKNWWNGIYEKGNGAFYLTFVFLTLILFVYCYFGSSDFFDRYIGKVENFEFWRIIYHNGMACVLFFGVGSIIFLLFGKISPKKLGLGLGDKKLGGILMIIGTFICAVCGLSCVLDKDMVALYPLFPIKGQEWYFILIYFCSYAMYYVGWEFLFRGIALNLTRDKIGDLGAILFTTLISALIHTSVGGFGKPMIETLSAIPAGLIFGYIAVKTQSIWYGFYLHMCVGFSTDIFITLLAK